MKGGAAVPAYVGIREAASRLKVSVPTLRRWDRSGRLRAARHPTTGARVYRLEDVDALGAAVAAATVSAPSTELVGRRRELREIDRQLRGRARVVTIVGPGGIGKTALMTAWIGEARARGQRVSTCELADERPAGVQRAVAAALGLELPEGANEDGAALRIARHCARAGAFVLAIDNAEHVVDEARALARAIVTSAPECRIVATSRRKLGLRAEETIELGPLALPQAGERVPERSLQSEAVSLIARAAKRAGGGGDLAPHALVLGRIARRLEGIPLALELAGARLASMSPPDLSRSLDARLDVLDARGGRRSDRHTTLSNVVAWSCALLRDDERAFFERCSVFRGGFTVAAAAQVGATDEGRAARTLEELEEHSLVRRLRDAKGEPRWDMFVVVRDVAAEMLSQEPKDEEDARARHAAHFARLAESVLEAPPTDIPVDALSREQQNVLVALERELPRGGARALLLAVATDHAAGAAVPIDRRCAMIDRAIRAARAPDRALLARGRAALGRLEAERGRERVASKHLVQAARDARKARDSALEEYALGLLAVAELATGSRARVIRAATHAERIASAAPRGKARALTWAHLGSIRHELGELDAAERNYTRALAIARADGPPLLALRLRARLGRVLCDRGRLDDASEALEGTAAALAEQGDRFAGWAYAHEALLRWRSGRLDDARVAYEHAVEEFDARGATSFATLHRAMLAALLASLGRGLDARTALAAASLEADADRTTRAELALAEAHRELLEARRSAATRAREEARVVRRALERTKHVRAIDKDARALGERLEATVGAALAAHPSLVVARDGGWVTPLEGARKTLPPTSPLRAILRALVDARGDELGADELLAVGWPGERVVARAAKHRVHAAIAELRGLGLGSALELSARGYRLAPGTSVRVEG